MMEWFEPPLFFHLVEHPYRGTLVPWWHRPYKLRLFKRVLDHPKQHPMRRVVV